MPRPPQLRRLVSKKKSKSAREWYGDVVSFILCAHVVSLMCVCVRFLLWAVVASKAISLPISQCGAFSGFLFTHDSLPSLVLFESPAFYLHQLPCDAVMILSHLCTENHSLALLCGYFALVLHAFCVSVRVCVRGELLTIIVLACVLCAGTKRKRCLLLELSRFLHLLLPVFSVCYGWVSLLHMI